VFLREIEKSKKDIKKVKKQLKKVILIKLMISFVIVNLLTGCFVFTSNNLISDFPPKPNFVKYTKDPVVEYNQLNNTYIITEEYMKNSLLMGEYLDEIKIWRTENGIK
jgi:hypothetical protein